MISSVLCPFLPAPEGVHMPGFNQVLLLFLGMQFSTGSGSLWSIEILPFAARIAQICNSLSEILQQTSPLLLGRCLQRLAWCQPAQSSGQQPVRWQVGQGRQELLFQNVFSVCVWGLC